MLEGDRVALEPGETCRVCHDCKTGHYELCPKVIFAATPPYDGTLAGFYKLPSDLCVPSQTPLPVPLRAVFEYTEPAL
jgi:threonine dehydrogenase-like Zn-dependent dehydrogenase